MNGGSLGIKKYSYSLIERELRGLRGLRGRSI